MSWLFQGSIVNEPPEDAVGFVYIIVNNINGKKYIGKKLLKFSKTTYKTVKLANGTKKKKRIKSKISSDWQTYYGSSPNLTEDINKLGKENFTRTILYFCRSKAECSYLEAKLQFEYRVLESDLWYNGIINVRVGSSETLRKALLEHDQNKMG